MELEALSDDELRAELTTWAGRVVAGEAVLLRLLGELDARGAWGLHGVSSCAHWASWRLGWSAGTARERVRVARALRDLPLLAGAFGAGRLSYAQVRAVTRVATGFDEHRWVELARHSTAAQLEQAVRGVRRSQANEQRATDPEQAAWQDQARVRWDDAGTLVLTLRIGPEHAPAVLAALEQGQQLEQADRDAQLAALATELASKSAGAPAGVPAGVPAGTSASPAAAPAGVPAGTSGETSGGVPAGTPEPYEFVDPPYPMLRPRVGLFEPRPAEEQALLDEYWAERKRRQAKADAWREHQDRLARETAVRELPPPKATLGDGLVRVLTRPAQGTPVRVQLLLDPVSGWARTSSDELLPPSTLRAVLRTLPGRQRAPRLRPLTPTDLHRFDQGRSNRLASPALRTLLGQLDGERCRFPGCRHTRHLHAHHLLFWSDGGPTDLANLVLVCSRHHRLIHRDGYRLTLHPDRTLHVHTPDGTRLPHHPALPWAPAEELPVDGITAETLPTHWTGERMDLGYVVNVLLRHAA